MLPLTEKKEEYSDREESVRKCRENERPGRKMGNQGQKEKRQKAWKWERRRKKGEAWRLVSGGTPRASICLAWAQKSLVFHPAAPGGMLFQAAWASMKNSFMWKRGDGGNRRKRGNKGRKEKEWEGGREGKKQKWKKGRKWGKNWSFEIFVKQQWVKIRERTETKHMAEMRVSFFSVSFTC